MELPDQKETLIAMGFAEFFMRMETGEEKFFRYDYSFPDEKMCTGVILSDGSFWQRQESLTSDEVRKLESLGLRDGTNEYRDYLTVSI